MHHCHLQPCRARNRQQCPEATAAAHKRQQQQKASCRARQRNLHLVNASPYFTTDTVTQEAFQEAEYESTQQGQRRKAWQAAVRSATGKTGGAPIYGVS
jgi:predicted ribonuclease toxin of YeeF-YezG toxin-antitoxin module